MSIKCPKCGYNIGPAIAAHAGKAGMDGFSLQKFIGS
jgi:hypothetical protein